MSPADFVHFFGQEGASAILRTGDADVARQAMAAAIRGGFRVVEFTMSIPDVDALIQEFAEQPDLAVGAGTVLTLDQLDLVVSAGAKFVVSPVVDVEIIKACTERNVCCMPGCATPSELYLAHRSGAQLQKLFPQTGTGPMYVKHCLGPLPFLRIVPTSGVTLENAREYLDCGSFAVGFVASLFHPEDMATENYAAIESRARAMMSQVQAS